MKKTTHVDSGRRLEEYANVVLVRCPKCDKAASVLRNLPLRQARLGCLSCGHLREKKLRSFGSYSGQPVDPFFGLPLWIQTPFRSGVLWAFNWQHLAELRTYVEADLRVQAGITTRSYFNALPRWIQAKGNRRAILAAIEKLWRMR